MNICLIKCPSPFLIDEKVFPPLGLMAVGTMLKQQGHKVCISEKFVDGFDCYGVGPTTPEYPHALSILEKTNKRVVLGGPHASEKCHEVGFFSVVIGDGESWKDRPFKVRGVYWAEENPLDSYPMIDRSLVSGYEYLINGVEATTIVTSRGCPYKCAFCSKQGNVRYRSAENVIEEIEHLFGLGYRALMFFDDTFIINKKRVEKICRCLKDLGIIWRCFVRGDLVDSDIAKLMAESGCVEVGMGIESGSDTILKNIHKGETTAQIKTAISMLRKNDIRVKGFFIVGLPGESPVTLEETHSFLNENPLDDMDFTIFQPYPGSDIVKNKEKYDINWDRGPIHYKGKFDKYESVVYTSQLSCRDIEIARDELCRI